MRKRMKALDAAVRHERIVQRFRWHATRSARGGRVRPRLRVDRRGRIQMLECAGGGRQAWRTLNPATFRLIACSGRLDRYVDVLPGLADAIAAARSADRRQGAPP